MHTPLNPTSLAPPAANYAHAVLSESPLDATMRWLHTSGVVPVRPDGTVPDDVGEQAATVWSNLAAMLTDARMSAADVVSMTTYVVVPDDPAELPGRLSAVMAARDEFMGGRLAASTLVTVPMLAQPAWQVEIVLIAAVAS